MLIFLKAAAVLKHTWIHNATGVVINEVSKSRNHIKGFEADGITKDFQHLSKAHLCCMGTSGFCKLFYGCTADYCTINSTKIRKGF